MNEQTQVECEICRKGFSNIVAIERDDGIVRCAKCDAMRNGAEVEWDVIKEEWKEK